MAPAALASRLKRAVVSALRLTRPLAMTFTATRRDVSVWRAS
jgi:hypothetical protein